MSQGNPVSGELYRHFKNKLYQIITIATHSETGEKLVVYQALYGDFQTYVRPYAMFVGEVDHEKYPEVTQKYRFQLIDRTQREESEEESDISDLKEEPQPENNSVEEPWNELSQVNPLLLKFLDEDDFDKKYDIVGEMASTITDGMIDNLAASLDVVIPEGSLEERYAQLKYCVRTRQRFQTNRFR